MAYIGNEPISAAFLVDTFSGNGSTVAFTMSVAPANTASILVAVTGVVQDPSTYSVSGTTLTFSAAPPTGTSNISVRYLGIPASGVTTTAYRTVTDTTATAGQTTFTIPSYTVGYVDVYRNGSRLAAADYTATTGTTVVLASAASAGDTITTESFYVSSVLNAIQQYNGTSVNQTLTTPTANTLTSASGSNLQLQTNGGTTALTLDTSGNAGLGVTPSSWNTLTTLQVKNASFSGYSNSAYVASNTYYNSGWKYIASAAASLYESGGGAHEWRVAAVGTAGNTISWNQAMTLDASGNLCLGTTSASGRLTVDSGSAGLMGSFNSTNANGGYFTLSTSGTVYGDIGTAFQAVSGSASDFAINARGARNLVFGTNNNERARITSSGGLWVGTTTRQSTSNHAFIQNTVNDWTANFQCNTGTSSENLGILVYYAGSSPNNTSAQFLRCQDPGGARAEFRSNGGLANYSANNANLSDVRTKTDIQDAGSYLSKICAIPVRTFKYKDQTDDLLNLGVIAQEVEAVAPELVDVSGFGETPEDGVPLKAIYQTDLQYALMKCIQEQQALITQLQADVAALKGQA